LTTQWNVNALHSHRSLAKQRDPDFLNAKTSGTRKIQTSHSALKYWRGIIQQSCTVKASRLYYDVNVTKVAIVGSEGRGMGAAPAAAARLWS
jgi:hypothetical protein